MRGVGQRVGGVGVHHQRDRATRVADALHGVDVPAWLDLDLDALVARVALDRHALDQFLEAVLDADGHARGDGQAAAAERLPERLLLLAREQVPGRHLDGGFGHEVAAHARQCGEDLARMRELDAHDQWRDKLGDDVPRRLGGLAAVVRIVLGDAFAPARLTATLDAHEQEAPVVRTAEAGLEMPDQRQAKQSNLEAFNAHRTVRVRSTTAIVSRR